MLKTMELINEAVIKVIGIGGGGGNAVEYMIQEHIEGVDFLAVNTDAQALRKTAIENTIQIGSSITKGLGAGANPEVGRNAAEEDIESLRVYLEGADMVFIAAGMGGGTGTGAAPVVAEIAKGLNILTVAIVTKPFSFEGKKRMNFAEQGIAELSKYVDSIITIPNDKLLKVLGRDISLLDAFGAANNILKNAVQGIAEIITRPGLMNVDFADVRTVMSEMGYAMMGSGIACGEDRAEKAAKMAISSPLLEEIELSSAKGVLVNITAGIDIRLDEFETVGNTIRAFSADNATVVIGTSLNPDMNSELRVTVVATGIGIDKCQRMMLLKTNKYNTQQQQPVFSKDKCFDHTVHLSTFNKEQKTVNTIVNDQSIYGYKETDYLDIPAFLRKQAD